MSAAHLTSRRLLAFQAGLGAALAVASAPSAAQEKVIVTGTSVDLEQQSASPFTGGVDAEVTLQAICNAADRLGMYSGPAQVELANQMARAGLDFASAGSSYLRKGPLDHAWTGFVKTLSNLGMPTARVLDSSPYDRVMRKFHNYMKDTPEFQQSRQGHQEFRFPPFSAWMVFTDMVSHACLSGQYAFVHTSLVRLENCRLPELAPINLLRQAAHAR